MLNQEQAQERLDQVRNPDYADELFAAAAKKLTGPLREAAFRYSAWP